MRACILILACSAALLCAQQSSQSESYTYDVNGNRVGGVSHSSAAGPGRSVKTERISTANGRSVPVETVEERIFEDGPRGRVIERTIQRYGQDGHPAGTERVRIEERPGGGGRTTITTTRYDSDLNGHFQIRERARQEATSRGNIVDATTTVERPTVNGSVEVVERRVLREIRKSDSVTTRDETVYRRNQSGQFFPAARETTETVKEGRRESITTTRYNTVNYDAKMEFAGQTVTDVETRADGSRTTVTSQYGATPPGRNIAAGARQAHLREQEITERVVRRDGTVVETTGVRRVSLSAPGELGAYEKVSEVVCTGNCLADSGKKEGDENKPATAGP